MAPEVGTFVPTLTIKARLVGKTNNIILLIVTSSKANAMAMDRKICMQVLIVTPNEANAIDRQICMQVFVSLPLLNALHTVTIV